MEKIILYTDGGARGNPGPAGAGVVITTAAGEVIEKACRPLGRTTNNEAEYQAVLLGLQTLERVFGEAKLREFEVENRLDSELVAKQLRGEYRIKEPRLRAWYEEVAALRARLVPGLTFTHVPRRENQLADEMANRAMDEAERQQ